MLALAKVAAFLLKHWKAALLLLLLAVYGLYAYHLGSRAAERKCADAHAKEVAAILADRDAAQAVSRELGEKLAAELAKPRSGPVIREVVRANPSACRVAKPVSDSLRDAIRQANASR